MLSQGSFSNQCGNIDPRNAKLPLAGGWPRVFIKQKKDLNWEERKFGAKHVRFQHFST
jgi:hypothetical protein